MIILLLFLLSVNVWAKTATLELRGIVHKTSVTKSDNKNIKIRSNYNYYLDYKFITGETKRKYFKQNEIVTLERNRVKEVIIYAP
jgi:hypothetical protein